jgi:dihydroxyacetone kinase
MKLFYHALASMVVVLVFASCNVIALVNGFGATPLMELYLFNNAVAKLTEAAGIKTYRTFVGNFMTSIDMAGASVTLLRLDAETKKLLDATSMASGFRV